MTRRFPIPGAAFQMVKRCEFIDGLPQSDFAERNHAIMRRGGFTLSRGPQPTASQTPPKPGTPAVDQTARSQSGIRPHHYSNCGPLSIHNPAPSTETVSGVSTNSSNAVAANSQGCEVTNSTLVREIALSA
jgi:hypothetical protein